jgi:hypothetical protein
MRANGGGHMTECCSASFAVCVARRMSEVSAAVSGLRLQQPAAQVDEMEDVRWFQRYVP